MAIYEEFKKFTWMNYDIFIKSIPSLISAASNLNIYIFLDFDKRQRDSVCECYYVL